MAIPSTSVMRQLTEEHMKIAQENIKEANAELKGVLGWLKESDLKGNWRKNGQEDTRKERGHCGYTRRSKEVFLIPNLWPCCKTE